MTITIRWSLGLALVLLAPLAVAQSNLGELLDAGAKKISAAEFKRDVVQRALLGPSPTGGTLEIMYTPTGSIQGMGAPPAAPQLLITTALISGEWTIDDSDRICTAMRLAPGTGAPTVLQNRCQVWFKLGDAYFVSDSDKDRGAKVFKRTPTAIVTALATEYRNLGELLDAGAKKISPEEFKRDVAQRTIVGPTPTGGSLEIMYATNGTIQGRTSARASPTNLSSPIAGEWEIDQMQRVCAEMRVTSTYGGVSLPARCQFWFKLGDAYFVSDSDKDRGAKVAIRTPTPLTTPPAAAAGGSGTPKALPASLAAGQSTLGELLDAGGKKVSSQELKRDIVGHAFDGPLPTIGNIEIAYLPDGTIQGQSPEPAAPTVLYPPSRVTGEWTIDDMQRLCSTVRIQAYGGQWAANRGVLPTSCQFWFKLADVYFVSDSDKDRSAKVIKRTPLAMPVAAVAASTPKPPPVPPAAAHSTLGELLDAGAKKISPEEFKRDVAQRMIVGPTTAGGSIELIYVANGTIQGRTSARIVGSQTYPNPAPLVGEWEIDQVERVCAAMRITPTYGATTSLPARCQFWFRLGDAYFIADSDSDRRAKVLQRTIQK